MLGLDKLLATILANAEMAAGHYESVLGVTQADQALNFLVVVDHLLTLLSTIFLRHTVDRFELER